MKEFQGAWTKSPEAAALNSQVWQRTNSDNEGKVISKDQLKRPHFLRIIFALLHRLFIKSYRDVVAYGIRIVMYLGMSASKSARMS